MVHTETFIGICIHIVHIHTTPLSCIEGLISIALPRDKLGVHTLVSVIIPQ